MLLRKMYRRLSSVRGPAEAWLLKHFGAIKRLGYEALRRPSHRGQPTVQGAALANETNRPRHPILSQHHISFDRLIHPFRIKRQADLAERRTRQFDAQHLQAIQSGEVFSLPQCEKPSDYFNLIRALHRRMAMYALR